MPNSEFLEKVPLYKKFPFNFSIKRLVELEKVNINMYCIQCKDIRTFIMINNYRTWIKGTETSMVEFTKNIHFDKHLKIPEEGIFSWLEYLCASCNKFVRHFIIEMNTEKEYLRKAGQFPPWDISIEKEVDRSLGDFSFYYKNGLICESQGYGIGAFSYYRRMIEGIIDHLLDQIGELIPEEDSKEEYLNALEKTKKTTVTQEKIKLVFDLLPPILNPQEFNPLKTLHSILSEGLHHRTDDECLNDAELLRESTIFLIKAVIRNREETKEFTEKMRKLLKKKNKI